MKRSHKIAAGIFASIGLGLAITTAYAHQEGMGGGMGSGMGPGMMQRMQGGNESAGMHGGMGHGMSNGMHGGSGSAGMGRSGGPGAAAGAQLMTPEEQTTLRDKMRSAATPEERQKIAQANRAEMQKRAKEKGITLPEGRGPGMGAGQQGEAHKH